MLLRETVIWISSTHLQLIISYYSFLFLCLYSLSKFEYLIIFLGYLNYLLCFRVYKNMVHAYSLYCSSNGLLQRIFSVNMWIDELFTYPISVPVLDNLTPWCIMTYIGPPGEGWFSLYCVQVETLQLVYMVPFPGDDSLETKLQGTFII